MMALKNMSHCTWYAEQSGNSCHFTNTWSHRLAPEGSNALVETTEMPEINVDITDFAPPQELKLAEERKLVAY